MTKVKDSEGSCFDEESYYYHRGILVDMAQEIFVFGSNLAGRHGKGAALEAVKYYGAKHGVGIGLVGNSYAIPTKRTPYETLPLSEIQSYVEDFLEFAASSKYARRSFKLTAIGCGLAGYTPIQIAPMFCNASSNVCLPQEFLDILNKEK